jgi:F0F1-type ATP synthase assembly protein I
MEIWQIVCTVVLLVFIAFNPKVQITRIFIEQLKVYTNDKTRKISLYDIASFIVTPIILAVIFAIALPYEELEKASGTIITVFSLVATLLLSFLALLVDKSTTSSKEKEVVKQTFVTITIDIVYSIFVVVLLAIPYFVVLSSIFEQIFVGMIAFLVIKILLNVFMILKRVFAVLNKDDVENKND